MVIAKIVWCLVVCACVLTGCETWQPAWAKNAFAPVPKLYLSVYYESNCLDSKSFILQQLQPAVKLLHNYLVVRLVPFGKSKSINAGFGGFECQHGPDECLGNMVQDCALYNMIMGRTDLERVNYVACEMETGASSKGNLQCVEEAGIKSDALEKCIENGVARERQLTSEYLTKLIEPKFIPTIIINGKFDQVIQDAAQTDLVGVLCSRVQETKPCAHYYNNIAMNELWPVWYLKALGDGRSR